MSERDPVNADRHPGHWFTGSPLGPQEHSANCPGCYVEELEAEIERLRAVLAYAKEEVVRFRLHTEGRNSESSPLEDDIDAALNA